jgi:hypothetical protein
LTKIRNQKLKIPSLHRNPLVPAVVKKGVSRHKNKLREERIRGNDKLE